MINKILGWSIFLLGLVIIGSTVYYTYNIFTGVSAAPQIFNIEPAENDNEIETEGGLEEELKKMVAEQLKNIIPFESLNNFTNLVAWTAGAWIIITGGTKISELGIKLIRIPSNKEE